MHRIHLRQNKIKFKIVNKQNTTVESSHSEVSEYETETEKSIKFHERNRTITEHRDKHLVVVVTEEASPTKIGDTR